MFYLLVGIEAIYCNINGRWKKYGIVFWTIVFIVTCFFYKNGMIAPSLDKRPAGIHYLSFGMMCTYILYKVLPDKKIRLLKWISINSMEIYYTHTFFILVMECIRNYLNINTSVFWLIEFAVGLFGGCISARVIEIMKNMRKDALF